MSAPPDNVASGPNPDSPGFYWRRQYHFGDTAKPGWRWFPVEVYRRHSALGPGPLETNGHSVDGVTWGPRIEAPS